MEVCPPAEICRDAFERMSRATVRMGSKGFATQAVGGVSLTASTKSLASSTTGNTNRVGAQNTHATASGQRAQASRPTRRHPTFDMDLSDLYQSPTTQQANLPPRRRSHQPTQAVTAQPEQYQPNPGFPQAYTGYEQPAQQQQQQQQPYYMAQSPQSVGSAPHFTPPAHPDQQHSLTDLSLDFLDFANNNAINQDPNLNNPDGSVNTAGLTSGAFNQIDPDGTGINLGGFGLDADYLRDLTTDGSGYDLMDGYWFGNSAI